MSKNINKLSSFSLSIIDVVRIAFWVLIVFMTWLFMHGAHHFLELTPDALGKYFPYKWIIIAHITAGGGSLILGLMQFWRKLRNYSWLLHRIVGTLYLLAVLVSSVCALILAFTTAKAVNWPYAFSLQIWVTVWISSTIIAYYAAIKHKFILHQQWMTRSYIVTLAFIISGLALKSSAVQALGSFEEISPSLFLDGMVGSAVHLPVNS